MSIAIFGGTFDPVHIGHLILLHSVLVRTNYKKVIVIPAHISNFKQNKEQNAKDTQRFEMLCIALKDYREMFPDDDFNRIELSAYELERGGISYTSDTVKYYSEKYNCRIGIIIGDDHIEKLTSWNNFQYLKENAEFIICTRNAVLNEKAIPYDVKCRQIEPVCSAPQSSTKIREDIHSHKNFLSNGVLTFIEYNNLYNIGNRKQIKTESDLQSYLRNTVSCNRYIHSIGVAETTDIILKHYKCEIQEFNGIRSSYFCGLAHDLGRELTDSGILLYCKENKINLNNEEKKAPVLAHGKVSALIASNIYPSYPESWKKAIEMHTTGGKNMDCLALALFIADYIEPGRKFMTKENRKKILGFTTIEESAMEVLRQMMYHWNEKENFSVSVKCTEMLQDLNERIANK